MGWATAPWELFCFFVQKWRICKDRQGHWVSSWLASIKNVVLSQGLLVSLCSSKEPTKTEKVTESAHDLLVSKKMRCCLKDSLFPCGAVKNLQRPRRYLPQHSSRLTRVGHGVGNCVLGIICFLWKQRRICKMWNTIEKVPSLRQLKTYWCQM